MPRVNKKAGEWNLESRQELRELSHQRPSSRPRAQPRNGLVRGPLGTSGCWIVLAMPDQMLSHLPILCPLALDAGPSESLYWPASQAGTEFTQMLAGLTPSR